MKHMDPTQPLAANTLTRVKASVTLTTLHLLITPHCLPLGPNTVKCHVVNVHTTPLEEEQHTYHQNIERIPTSHN